MLIIWEMQAVIERKKVYGVRYNCMNNINKGFEICAELRLVLLKQVLNIAYVNF